MQFNSQLIPGVYVAPQKLNVSIIHPCLSCWVIPALSPPDNNLHELGTLLATYKPRIQNHVGGKPTVSVGWGQ